MRFFFLILVGLSMPLTATEAVNFLNLNVTHDSGGLVVEAEPETLMDYKLLRDENYSIDKYQYDMVLDANFRQTAFLMRTLERNRGSIFPEGKDELPIISFTFELALRRDTGEPIKINKYKVTLGLDKEFDTGFIKSSATGERHTFNMSKLKNQDHYDEYLANVILPQKQVRMPQPTASEFIVDLYYHWPHIEVPEKEFDVLSFFPALVAYDKGRIKDLRIHMGTTYCYKKEGEWKQVRSQYLRSYKDSIDAYTNLLTMKEEADADEMIGALEDYVTLVPGDRNGLKMLMDSYLEDQKETEAYDLITRFQPFFATIREGIANRDDLARSAKNRRNQLLGRKAGFDKDSNVVLEITSPADKDLVTGTTNLEFTLAGHDAPILVIECFVDEELIARIQEPPFKVPFTVDGSFGLKRLRVNAYFEDETYQTDEILVDTLKVDEEEEVSLVAIQATVFNTNSSNGSALTKEDFTITQNKEKKEIAHFRKSEAPLRLAILLDTSISMYVDKLHRTQYAVKTFLSKLDPEDKASIFTFDSKVLRLCDFTNDFEEVGPQLMTLSPHGATSLYDGMLVAHDALMGQNGTKVLIVISDGADSSSLTTDIHVAKMLRYSPVMVYSIVLPEGFLGQSSAQGNRFLAEMSRLSGSVHTKAGSVKKLSETFDQIYADLKNLYYFDYYSDGMLPSKRDIRIKVKRSGAKVRFRALN